MTNHLDQKHVIRNFPDDISNALDTLYAEYNIGCAVFGGELQGIRLCPHVYNTMEEIDLAVDAVVRLVGN